MIRICSLDFLYKERFESDVITADGNVLCRSGEEITPELILKLYFKEIYIEEKIIEKEHALEVKHAEELSDLPDLKASSSHSSAGVNVTTSNVIDGVLGGKPSSTEEEQQEAEKTISVDVDQEEISIAEAEVLSKESDDGVASGGRLHGSHSTSTGAGESINISSDTDAVEAPVNQYFEFDEDQAKRIVEHAMVLGKMLKFSASELNELEQAAYNYNLGISKFKLEDASKRGFRKMKAFASSEKLKAEGKVSDNVVETVKLSASPYESDSFPLNSKIPHPHIIAITGCYEDLLSEHGSKEFALKKMLQMGGNHFNIFILHKFIRLMKDLNE